MEHCQDAWSLVLILEQLELLGHLALHVLDRDPYFLDPFLDRVRGLLKFLEWGMVVLVESHQGLEMMRLLISMMLVVRQRFCLRVQLFLGNWLC